MGYIFYQIRIISIPAILTHYCAPITILNSRQTCKSTGLSPTFSYMNTQKRTLLINPTYLKSCEEIYFLSSQLSRLVQTINQNEIQRRFLVGVNFFINFSDRIVDL